MIPQHPELAGQIGIEAESLLSALRTELPTADLEHVPGCQVTGGDDAGLPAAVAAAEAADLVLLAVGDRAGMFGGGTSGEGCDAEDLALPGRQPQLVEAVLGTGTPTVMIMVSGRPYALGPYRDRLAASVQAFFPGEEGGGALAGVLSGRVNPTGKLPVGVPHHVGGSPHTYLAPPLGQNSQGVSNLDPSPAYAFGHGLSYTTFAYADLAVDHAEVAVDGAVEVSVTVTNTGGRDGVEVVQLYAADPVATVTRPVTQLVGFARVPLAVGASSRVTFTVHTDRLSFTGRDLTRIVEPGEITFRIGTAGEDFAGPVVVRLVGADPDHHRHPGDGHPGSPPLTRIRPTMIRRRGLLVRRVGSAGPADGTGDGQPTPDQQRQHGHQGVLDDRDPDDLVHPTETEPGVGGDDREHVAGSHQPTGATAPPDPVHLGDHEDGQEAEQEHRPDAVRSAVHDRHQGAVHSDQQLQAQRPDPVGVGPGQEQAALDQDQEHVEEADQVTGGVEHRVVPEGVDRRPAEQVAVVLAGEVDHLRLHRHRCGEEHPAPSVLHQQHHDQQQDDRPLRAEDRHVLGQTVVEQLRLQLVQADEDQVGHQGDDVDRVQRPAVRAHPRLGVEDQPPGHQLVRDVARPGGQPRPHGRVGQLPAVPRRSLVGEQVLVVDPEAPQPDQEGQHGAGQHAAEQDPPGRHGRPRQRSTASRSDRCRSTSSR